MTVGDAMVTILSGIHRDLFAALLETLPLWLWVSVWSDRSFRARWHRVVLLGFLLVAAFGQIFNLFVEFFFFEEFKSRFNTVAVDYLLYPKEVFVNIWESSPVGWILVICLLLSIGWLWWAGHLFSRMWEHPSPPRSRWLWLGAAAATVLVVMPTLDLKGSQVSRDRTLNEVANNGALSFIAAAWTHDLDYSAYYRTLPASEAYQRARRLLVEPGTRFTEEGESIRRQVSGDSARPRLNVVVFLEESLGSEFWGCLGRPKTLTPEMDKLANQEGMLFTNIYACGNRTVRGMEGVLSSFPPLPGDSIVKRDQSDNVETIARVLKRDGYATVFLYGGRGLFDGMRSFAVRNGYDRFVEEKQFAASDLHHDLGRVRRGFVRPLDRGVSGPGQDQPTVFRHHPLGVQPQTLCLSQGPNRGSPQAAARGRSQILGLRPGPVFRRRQERGLLDQHDLCRDRRPRGARLWEAEYSDSFLRDPARDCRAGGGPRAGQGFAVGQFTRCGAHYPWSSGKTL